MDISSILYICVKVKIREKCQYLVCAPPAWITAKKRRLILFMSRLMTCKGVYANYSCKTCSRSLTLLTSFRYRNLRPRWSHMCSIGEISDDLEGLSNVLMLRLTQRLCWRNQSERATLWRCVRGTHMYGRWDRSLAALSLFLSV